MTKDEAMKTIWPDLHVKLLRAANEASPGSIDFNDGFCDLDVGVSLGDHDEVAEKYGEELADALFGDESQPDKTWAVSTSSDTYFVSARIKSEAREIMGWTFDHECRRGRTSSP